MKRLDKYGFDMRVSKGNDSGILRIPFGEFPSHTSRQRYRLVFPTSLSYSQPSQPSPPTRSICLFRAMSPAPHAPARSGALVPCFFGCSFLKSVRSSRDPICARLFSSHDWLRSTAEPVTERKAVKEAIVALSKQVAAKKAELGDK